MTAHPEGHMQEVVARYLDVKGLPWIHVPNERKCTPAQGALLKRQGVKAGVPDILIFKPFEKWIPDRTPDEFVITPAAGLAIELKAPGGRLTETQREWADTLTRCSWYVTTCRSVDEVIELIEWAYGRRVDTGPGNK